ncbi:MAG: HAD family hydrolase [Henriciella sp.]|nr:HAD family hydrolase [Henriciella sp.]
MIKAVLFDLDETLFDRSRTLPEFLADQFTRFQPRLGEVSLETWRSRFLRLDAKGQRHKSVVYPELLSAFGGDPDAAPDLLEDYYQCSTAQAFEMPGMSNLLADLRRSGMPCGLITNGETRLQSRTIAALGLADRMEVILISEAEGVRKPDPMIFHRAAEQLRLSPEACLYVGDNPEADVCGALDAGLKAVWFNPSGQPWPDRLSRHAGPALSALPELLDLFKII